jgi:hypothetical protein
MDLCPRLQPASGLANPVLLRQRHSLGPQLPGQAFATGLAMAPLLDLAAKVIQSVRDWLRWLRSHQRSSRKSVRPAHPRDPLHGPPIRSAVPTTADNTPSTDHVHAALPKAHERLVVHLEHFNRPVRLIRINGREIDADSVLTTPAKEVLLMLEFATALR